MTSSALLPCALGDGHFRGPVLEGVRPVGRCYLSQGLVAPLDGACSTKARVFFGSQLPGLGGTRHLICIGASGRGSRGSRCNSMVYAGTYAFAA